jgi:hypothetical protein
VTATRPVWGGRQFPGTLFLLIKQLLLTRRKP